MSHEQDKFQKIRQSLEGRGALFYRSHLSSRGKKSGDRLVFACPFHGEKDASFTTYDDARFHCFGCGAHGDAIDFLGRYRNLDPKAATAAIEQWLGIDAVRPKPAATVHDTCRYSVRDANGELQATHVRTDTATGKQFKWLGPDGTIGLNGRSQSTLPLYNSEWVRDWTTGPLIVVEGEKSADHLVALGLHALATFGANTVPNIISLTILTGRDVVLWPDDDTPGRDHMRRIAEVMHDSQPETKVRLVQNDGETKQDAVDLAPDQLTAEHILAERTAAFVYDARAEADPTDESEMAQAIAAYDFATLAHVAENLAETTWLWPGFVPRGYLTILAGEPGAGKSGLALWLAKTATQGEIWPDGTEHGEPVGKVLWLETDDCHGALRDRAAAWALPTDAFLLLGKDGLGQIDLGRRNALPKLAQLIAEQGVGLVVIDTLAGSHDQDENSATIKTTISTLAKLAQQCQVPVLATHHLRKRSALESGVGVSMDRVRGSTAIVAGARSIIGIDRFKTGTIHQEGPDKVRLSMLKANFCALAPPLIFMQTEKGLEFEDYEEPTAAQSVNAAMANRSVTEIIIEAVLNRLQAGPAKRQELVALTHILGFREMAFERAVRDDDLPIQGYKIGRLKWYRLPEDPAVAPLV